VSQVRHVTKEKHESAETLVNKVPQSAKQQLDSSVNINSFGMDTL